MDEKKDVDIPEKYKIDYLEMSDGAKLRHIYYRPDNPLGTVFLYPGMNTLVMSWIKVLNMLSERNIRVEYVESREKHTSIVNKNHVFSKERMILDMVESVNKIDFNGDYIAMGSSLGSTTMLHALAERKISPSNVILVGPNLEFKTPMVFRILLPFVNDWLYKHFALFIIKTVILGIYTNKKKDPFQYKKYKLALELAEVNRLKKSLKAWQGNKLHDVITKIDGETTKCYLIGASLDKLHPDHDTKYIAEHTPNAEFIDLLTNSAAHDKPVVDLIENIINNRMESYK